MIESGSSRGLRRAALLLLLALAACGGGGGDSPSNTASAANQPPVARLTASDSDGFAPLEVTFDASASSDADGTIAGYTWDFGDDSPSGRGATVSHRYGAPGAFTVTLRVTDDDGASATARQTIRVRGVSVSGVIRIAPESQVDSDVNDRFTTPVSNNGFGVAQPLDSPVRLGGFVNQPSTGSADGNFRETGDVEDVFVVDLDGGEAIVLSIGEPTADLDLELYRDAAEPELVDASVSPEPGSDRSEDLVAPDEPARYFVRVAAVSGASTYVLSIGDEAALPARRRAKRLSDPFVSGEVLLAGAGRRMVERYAVMPDDAAGGTRLQRLGRRAARPVRMRLPRLRLPPEAAVAPAVRARYRTLHAARTAGARGDVRLAELNVIRRTLRTPDDPFFGDQQWHYRAIELGRAWTETVGDATPPVVVAVVDTGVLLDHPDLRNRLLRDGAGRVIGYDFVQDPERANDGDGIDPDPDDPGDDELGPDLGSFHGTHVAGTVAADSDNGLGVAGVSWGARLMPVRALGVGGGTTFDVMQAVRYAAGLDNVSGTAPPVRADVINLSLGSDFYSEAEQQTLSEVRARGIFVVASAGNASSSRPSYPAAYDGVVAVAATDIHDQTTAYSNFGAYVDLAAPGGDGAAGVLSTLGSGGGGNVTFGYDFLAGTSMAAPHVSGVVALMKAVHPELTPGQFDTLLQGGRLTVDAGEEGRDDRFGWGIVNAYQSVLTARDLESGQVGPLITTSVRVLDFQAFTRQLDFSVSNDGDAPVRVEVRVIGEAPWLTLVPADVDDDGFGRYQATVDRGGLDPGVHRAVIAVEPLDDGVPGTTIDVVLQVVLPDPEADAGQHYVVLVDPADEDSTVAVEVVTAANGEYRFDLQDVPPGAYRLFAGTDLDDDDLICDGGEACGAFPSLSDPEILTIDARDGPAVEALDFASEFRSTTRTTADGGRAPVRGASIRKRPDPGEEP